jgi:V8-like Glu-specific endopeptidase
MGRVGLGTGLLISQDLVLTVTHIILKSNKYFKNHRFYLAQNVPLGKYLEAKSYYFPEKYKTLNSPTFDDALLPL